MTEVVWLSSLIKMGPANCAVVGCMNNTRKLEKWRKSICTEHNSQPQTKGTCASCQPPPYRLFCFPSTNRYLANRLEWVRRVKREKDDKSSWSPRPSDRVCSDHFVDAEPTCSNPYPSLKLGYDFREPVPRRELIRQHQPRPKKAKKRTLSPGTSDQLSQGDHQYCRQENTEPCLSCIDKQEVINSSSKELSAMSLKLKISKRREIFNNRSHNFTWVQIKTDKKMVFFTGLCSVAAFNTVFSLIEPNLPAVNYWRGTKRHLSTKVRRKFVKCQRKKLSFKDEFLLTLMRLHLGLLNEDLADRFNISPATCSNIFTTWVRILSTALGNCLVNWLPREAIRDHLPNIYKKMGHYKLRCIIDCTEVFIERPKSLELQAQTWSDYKSHNTIKFLIGISPAGFITFLSDCYGGRTSDKYICEDSGFFDALERDDEIMADRGFQIKEDLLLRFCSLSIPPGARIKAQMTTEECKRTKDVANLRIHIERAINRMKTFRILKYVLPITMLQHADHIVRTCAALCNLKPRLIQAK